MKRFVSSFIFVLLALLTLAMPSYAMNFVAEDVYRSVVVITSEGNEVFGSGFAVTDSYVVTNFHVIDGLDPYVRQYDDDTLYKAKIVAADADRDLAILHLSRLRLPVIQWEPTAIMKTGADVYAIGAPVVVDLIELEYTITRGILSSKSRSESGQKYLQTDAPINPGNSGGPLLNEDGHVVGVNTWKIQSIDGFTPAEGLGFAVPAETMRNFLVSNGFAVKKLGDGNLRFSPPPKTPVYDEPDAADSMEEDIVVEDGSTGEPSSSGVLIFMSVLIYYFLYFVIVAFIIVLVILYTKYDALRAMSPKQTN